MSFHFTQSMSVRKTGFGNSVVAEVGTPTPIASEFEQLAGAGCSIVGFDAHPYLATSGYGNLDGSDFPEQSVLACDGVLRVYDGSSTVDVSDKDYSAQPSFWDIEGEPGSFGFEVQYDSTVEVTYSLDRCSFAFVDVADSDGNVTRFENVACLQLAPVSTTFRMWGQTDSWGSEGEKVLFVPWQDTRDW